MVRTVIGRVNRPISAGTTMYRAGDGVTTEQSAASMTLTRPSLATYITRDATLAEVAANTARVTNSDLVGINAFDNPWFVGATVGTPNVYGTGIVMGSSAASREIVATGVEANGVPYIDIRFWGIPFSAGSAQVIYAPVVAETAAIGETWTVSTYFKVTGDSRNVSDFVLRVYNQAEPTYLSKDGVWRRYTNTRTLTSGNATIAIRWSYWNDVDPVDFTIRFGGLMLERGGTAASRVVYPAYNTIRKSAAYLGNRLLLEERRTNLVPNPRGENTGTMPADWGSGGTLIASGVEDGIPYIDTQYNVPGSATSGFTLHNAVPTDPNLTYTGSYYLKLVSGDLSQLSALQVNVLGMDSGSAATVNTHSSILADMRTNEPLSTQRKVVTATMNAATTQVVLRIRVVNGSASTVPITFRIGAPQLELGFFATSPILPPVGTPGAYTREADSYNMLYATLVPNRPLVGNVYTQSDNFNDAVWAKGTITINSDVTPGPFTGTTADAVVASPTTSVHQFNQPTQWTDGKRYSVSIYVKAGVHSFFRMTPVGTTLSGAALGLYYNLTTGEITFAGSTAAYNKTTPFAENVGGGWWRCGFELTSEGTVFSGLAMVACEIAGNQSFTGDGVSESIYIWGAQVSEANTTPAYLPTTTAAVPHSRGTVVATYRFMGTLPNSGIAPIVTLRSANNNYIAAVVNGATGAIEARVSHTGNTVVSGPTGRVALVNRQMRVALSWDTASGYVGIAAHNGDADGWYSETGVNIMPNVETVTIGDSVAVPLQGVQEFENVQFFPQATAADKLASVF